MVLVLPTHLPFTSGAGSAADATSGVDPALRVRGVEGLRVFDASMMPTIVSANTNAPVMAIAHRAVDLMMKAKGRLNAPDAQAPGRMCEAVRDRRRGVGARHGVVLGVQRLQEEVGEIHLCETLRGAVGMFLREDQLEFVAGPQHQVGARFRAHADPVEAERRRLRPIRLDGNGKAAVVERRDGRRVELEQGLPPGADDEPPSAAAGGPARGDMIREEVRGFELAAVGTDTDEIGITKAADGT